MTQKDILLHTLADLRSNLNSGQWIYSYHIIKSNTKYGWLGTAADALARKLRKDGLIESKEEGQYVLFRITDKGLEYLQARQEAMGFKSKPVIKTPQTLL